MRANLHIHSRFSDGMQWPKDIVNRANNSKTKLELIALTDHDTLGGNPEFFASCDNFGIEGIAGVEIDCGGKFKVDKESETQVSYQSEVLGYFPDQSYPHTQELLRPIITQRREKMQFFIEKACEIFNRQDISWEDFQQYRLASSEPERNTLDFTYMKPHLFLYLNEKKVRQISGLEYPDFKEIYFNPDSRYYLGYGLNLNVSIRLNFEDVVKVIQKDKGFAVIPHLALRFVPRDARNDPLRIKKELERNRQIYLAFLQYCHDLNIWGIEMYYYKDWEHQPDMIDFLNEYMQELVNNRFHYTWGSDCHGIGSSSDTLEKFYGDFPGFF